MWGYKDLKSVDRKVVRVRVPPSAPIISIITANHFLTMDQRNGVNSVARIVYVQIAEKDHFLT